MLRVFAARSGRELINRHINRCFVALPPNAPAALFYTNACAPKRKAFFIE